jgi:mono/diheme cytochrome c family protein
LRHAVSILAASALVAGCASQQAVVPPTGEDTFARHCASCHGARGDGTGPVAGVLSGTIPNLTTLSRRSGGEFPADRVASYIDGRSLPPVHGSRTMPVWGTTFDATARLVVDAQSAGPRVADVVEYLRSIQR